MKQGLDIIKEAWWHIGMSSASHWEDPGLNPGKGRFFRIKMKYVTFELLRCSYPHIWWIYRQSPVKSPDLYSEDLYDNGTRTIYI